MSVPIGTYTSLYLQKDVASLERIQRKAARFCSKNYHPTASVSEMLQDLGWTSLELRTITRIINLLYKMSRGHIDIDVNSYLQPHSEVRTRGSHRYRCRQGKATKNIYFYSFFSRTIRVWNKLPAEIVESKALAVFNCKLFRYPAKNHQTFILSYFILYVMIHIFLYMYYPSLFINFIRVLYIFYDRFFSYLMQCL